MEPPRDAELIKVARNGKELGSFTEADIRTGLVRGTLSASDHCWRNGMSGWKTLGELLPEFCPPPPAPVRHAPVAAQTVVVNKVTVKNQNDNSGGCGCSSGCAVIIIFLAIIAVTTNFNAGGAALPIVICLLIVGGIVFAYNYNKGKEDED